MIKYKNNCFCFFILIIATLSLDRVYTFYYVPCPADYGIQLNYLKILPKKPILFRPPAPETKMGI